ncbi:MAG TPA: hypothetical protein VNO43_06400 [Candidatus Eisenbacteria bacterium]|nr:hypothetical protein [Candidatus Eisenbacteria bacterium]
MKVFRTLLLGALASFVLLAGCGRSDEDKGAMERAGKAADEALEKAREQTGKALERAGEAMKEAGEKMQRDEKTQP